ncbi:MAG: hypothetical protein KDK65_02670, partial [Chlamydiia bacterium]|nr:hypothetical protein [Chlamydiia bacterium]
RERVEDLSFSSRNPAAAAASPSPGSTSNVSSREVSALQDSVATLQRQLSSPTVSPDLSNLLQRITVLENKNIQLEADIKVLKATSQPFVSTSTAIGMIVALAAFTFYFFNHAMTARQPQAS